MDPDLQGTALDAPIRDFLGHQRMLGRGSQGRGARAERGAELPPVGGRERPRSGSIRSLVPPHRAAFREHASGPSADRAQVLSTSPQDRAELLHSEPTVLRATGTLSGSGPRRTRAGGPHAGVCGRAPSFDELTVACGGLAPGDRALLHSRTAPRRSGGLDTRRR